MNGHHRFRRQIDGFYAFFLNRFSLRETVNLFDLSSYAIAFRSIRLRQTRGEIDATPAEMQSTVPSG